MTGNKSSKLCWAYQSAVGTEAIDDATDTTYFFGEYTDECGDWNVPSLTKDVESYYAYSSREASLTPSKPQFDLHKITYCPTTAQYLCWMLKQVTEDGESANVHKVEVLDTGLPLPLTTRIELLDGSVDRLYQCVDAYSVKLGCTAMIGSPFMVEQEFAFGRLEDWRGQWKADDTVSAVAGDVITLTNEPQRAADYYNGWLVFVSGGDQEDETFTVADSDTSDPPKLTLSTTPNANIDGDTIKLFDKERPVLTTSPSMPGQTAVNAYQGTPEVYWDVADQNVALVECWKAQWYHEQQYKTAIDTDARYQTVYLYKHLPIKITLECVLERNKPWTDYIDTEARQVNIKVYKPDSTYYVLHKLYNCYVTGIQETGHFYKGHYNARIFLTAESCIGNFTLESETNWSTHYKHVA